MPSSVVCPGARRSNARNLVCHRSRNPALAYQWIISSQKFSKQDPEQQSESKKQLEPSWRQVQTPLRQTPWGARQTTPQLPQFCVSRLGSMQPKSPQTLPLQLAHVPPAQYPLQHCP